MEDRQTRVLNFDILHLSTSVLILQNCFMPLYQVCFKALYIKYISFPHFIVLYIVCMGHYQKMEQSRKAKRKKINCPFFSFLMG